MISVNTAEFVKTYLIDLTDSRSDVLYVIEARYIWLKGDGTLDFRFDEDRSFYSYIPPTSTFYISNTPIRKIYITNELQQAKSVVMRVSNLIAENV